MQFHPLSGGYNDVVFHFYLVSFDTFEVHLYNWAGDNVHFHFRGPNLFHTPHNTSLCFSHHILFHLVFYFPTFIYIFLVNMLLNFQKKNKYILVYKCSIWNTLINEEIHINKETPKKLNMWPLNKTIFAIIWILFVDHGSIIGHTNDMRFWYFEVMRLRIWSFVF